MAATWFKCEPIGFLTAFERIGDLDQAMVYVVVCLRIYLEDGSVPNRPDSFAAQCNMGRTRVARAIAKLVEQGRLKLVDGELTNPRADEEIEARRAVAASKSHPGKAGRKPRNRRENGEKPARDREETGNGRRSLASPDEVSGAEMAENSHSPKSDDFYARARSDQIREESPPTPQSPRRHKHGLDPMPDGFGEGSTPADAANAISATVERPDLDPAFTSEVTMRVLQLANIASPPFDMPLVTGWLRMGCDPDTDIYPHVARLTGNSRGPVRALRYFDREIREQFEAKRASRNSNIAYFRRIRAQHEAEPGQRQQG
jgi:uncharacterized protein YdaU (DUF1376 family)